VRVHVFAALAGPGWRFRSPIRCSCTRRVLHASNSRWSRKHASRCCGRAVVRAFTTITARWPRAHSHAVWPGRHRHQAGRASESLYILARGQVAIFRDVDGAATRRKRLASLPAPHFSAKWGSDRGEAATVPAHDVVCYRLDKSGFESIIKGRPDIAEAMSRVLAMRHEQLQDRRTAAQNLAREPMRHADILDRIRSFFGPGA
jgi:hypothetical protein